ncbi:LptF/LptG family permease [Chitinophaga barathri]|uniref:YjgP/YjgQ family permease n=1 Tax=Chitinophaga barathri TaxID=1647451 RepID=A0A3N4M6M7_9BACT|nr:LptF/LptG family permease [Chitinophaga barathri]RPD38931.1 YjgP/YjgQ family permease [Chitinophaga barathri]
MKKLDWYILRKFIGTFIYSLMILLVISVVIDITEKIDDFLEHDLSIGFVFMHYYIGFIPHIAALLFPLFIFISVIFFTSKLAYKTEIVAILSAGVSFRRFLRPYWVGAILFASILWAANRWVVPAANRIRTTFENKYVSAPKDAEALKDKTLRVDSVTYITFGYYDPNYKNGSNFVLKRINGQQVVYNLKADRVSWDSVGRKWKLDFITERTINGMRETLRQANDTSIKIPLHPSEMVEEKNKEQAMTTPELNRYLEREELRGAEGLNVYYVEKHRRTSAAVAVIILVLIGAIISSRKVRGGSGLHLALGIVISAMYILFMQFSTVFATKADLNPLLAAWIPNFVFAGLALYLYSRAPK